jgi:Dolichyl-phosphate-mannose-protein mannosyltransferase
MPLSLDDRERRILGLTRFDWSVAAMVLAIKVLVLIFGAMAFEIGNDERVRSLDKLLDIWNQWDGHQYLLVAQQGYAASGDRRLALAFFPLYPWLIRLATYFVHDAVRGAFLISTVASVAAGIILGRLVAIDHPRPVAWRAVWFMFIFPTSYFMHTDYSEGLFLALVLWSFLAARRERWMESGIAGALAALSRPNGILLVPALGAEAIAHLWHARRFDWRWLFMGVMPLGLAAYFLVNYRVTGDPWAFLSIQREHWSNDFATPWASIRTSYQVARDWKPAEAEMVGTQVLIYLAIGLAGTIAAIVMLRPSYGVWMALNWLLIATRSWDISAPRYVLTMFPLFILLSLLARRRIWEAGITAWSLLWLAFFVSEFVRGQWAF